MIPTLYNSMMKEGVDFTPFDQVSLNNSILYSGNLLSGRKYHSAVGTKFYQLCSYK